MSMTLAGYILLAVVWVVVLAPIITGLVRFIRTTKLSDLKLRIRRVKRTVRVPDCHGVRMVSAQRASIDPGCWEPATPFAWRHK